MSVPAPDIAPTDQTVGVDLGIVRPAVTSHNQFLGKRAWKAIEGRLFHLKRKLQQKGTRSAKRHLRRVRRKQARFRRNTDHILSKQIVASVEPGATIVVENLTDIRKRTTIKRKTETSLARAFVVVRATEGLYHVQSRGTRLYGGCGRPATHLPGVQPVRAYNPQQPPFPWPFCVSDVWV